MTYADRLADFIIDHIGKPYTAEECGHVLEIGAEAAERALADDLADVLARGATDGWSGDCDEALARYREARQR